jgi:uncharacterized protein YjbJ (UPF0337 family)
MATGLQNSAKWTSAQVWAAATWQPIHDCVVRKEVAIMGAGDKARNKTQKLIGKTKQELGRVTGDRGLEDEGTVDRIRAKAKEAGEKVKDTVRGRR